MSEVTVTLNDVESRDVQARGEAATVYSFKTSDGRKYTTFKRDVAVPGSQLRGRLVTIGYTEKQNGEYTNYYLNSIKLADTGQERPVDAIDLAYDAAKAAVRGITPEPVVTKDVNIARAVALKAAVETAALGFLDVSVVDDVLKVADVYAGWLLTGSVVDTPVAAGDFPF